MRKTKIRLWYGGELSMQSTMRGERNNRRNLATQKREGEGNVSPVTPKKSVDLDDDHVTPTRSMDRLKTMTEVLSSPKSLRRRRGENWEQQVEERLAQLEQSLLQAEAANATMTANLETERALVQRLTQERDEAQTKATSLVAELDTTKRQVESLRSELFDLRELKINNQKTIRDLETHLIQTKLEMANALALLDLRSSKKKKATTHTIWTRQTSLRNWKRSGGLKMRSQSLSAIPTNRQILSVESSTTLDSIIEEEAPPPRRASLQTTLATDDGIGISSSSTS